MRQNGLAPVNVSRAISNRSSAVFRVSHTELIVSPLAGSIDYSVNNVSVNPGLPNLFPWLSSIAPLFEKYSFERLQFRFMSMSNTSQTGSTLMSFDYDPTDAAPITYSSFTMNTPSLSVSSWKDCVLVVPPVHLRRRRNLYTRDGPVPSGSDPKFYDIGSFNYGAIGNADESNLGTIFVDYTVVFTMPQSYSPKSDTYVDVENATGQDAANPFGTVEGDINLQGDYPPALLTLPRTFNFNNTGNYVIICQVWGTGVTEIDINLAHANGATMTALPVVYDSTGDIAVGYSYLLNANIGTLVTTDITATTVTRCLVSISPMDYNFSPI